MFGFPLLFRCQLVDNVKTDLGFSFDHDLTKLDLVDHGIYPPDGLNNLWIQIVNFKR